MHNERDEPMTTTTERIAELTAAWEEGANYGELPEYHVRASDYALSEDDWRAYLSDDEAAEIVALIERQAENQERAEAIAAAVLTKNGLAHWMSTNPDRSPLAILADSVNAEDITAEEALTQLALAALTETENRK